MQTQSKKKKSMTVSFNYHFYMNIDNTTPLGVEETDILIHTPQFLSNILLPSLLGSNLQINPVRSAQD